MSDQFLDVDDELPVEEEVGIESILNQLLDLMAVAKSMPLSSSVMVSREEVTSLVHAAIECLPDELRQAVHDNLGRLGLEPAIALLLPADGVNQAGMSFQ